METETIEAADLESLRFMAEAQAKQIEAARAAQGGFKLFQSHLSAKYKLKQGDGLDMDTGAITRINGDALPSSEEESILTANEPLHAVS